METDEAKKIYQQREAVAKFPNAGIKNKIGDACLIPEEIGTKYCN
jgi:hypothetical protein